MFVLKGAFVGETRLGCYLCLKVKARQGVPAVTGSVCSTDRFMRVSCSVWPRGMRSELSMSPIDEFTRMTWWAAGQWHQTEQHGRGMDVWCRHQTVGLTADSARVQCAWQFASDRCICVCILCSVHVYRCTSSFKQISTSHGSVQGLSIVQSCYRSADVWMRAGVLLVKKICIFLTQIPW